MWDADNWVTVPTNSILTIHRQTVMIHPIIDEFWSPNPGHTRSAQFAQTKGQTITNERKQVIVNGGDSAASGGVDANALRMKVEALAVQ
jgi:glutamine amidotransferase